MAASRERETVALQGEWSGAAGLGARSQASTSRTGMGQPSRQPVTRPIFCTVQLTASVRRGQNLFSHRDDMHSNETFQNNHPWKTWKISDPVSATNTENSSQHRPHRDLRMAPRAHAGTGAITVALPHSPHQSGEILNLITKISQITSADTQPSPPAGDDIHFCSALASALSSPLCIPTREMPSTIAGSSACARHAFNAHTIHRASASCNNSPVLRLDH
jgi:hypothetical protein